MAKYVATPVGSGFGAQSNLNQNFEEIEDNFQRVLYRDGSTPNQMESNIDMNGFTIYNAGSVSADSMTINGQVVVANQTFVTELPDPTGQGGKYVRSDGAAASWQYILDTDLTLKGAVSIPVDTVADMKALTGLEDGAFIQPRKYNSSSDFRPKQRRFIADLTPPTEDGGYIIHDDAGAGYFTIDEFEGPIDIGDFGAYGAVSVAAATAAVQACLDYCAANNKQAVNSAEGVTISSVTVPAGVRGIDFTEGVVNDDGSNPTGVIILGTSSVPLTTAKISARINMAAGSRTAIYGYDTKDCEISGCTIYGFTNHATLNHYAILLNGDVRRNIIKKNHITGYNNPTQRGLMIDFQGGGQTDYGGFFTGTIVRDTEPCVGNIVTENTVLYGSYAVVGLGLEKSIISKNYCYLQNHRSLYFANACYQNTICENICDEFLSTAVLLGYGCAQNVVANNVMNTATASGEAAVNINTGSKGNLVIGNKIYAASNYGVYVATDSTDNSIIGNDIGNHYLAAICVENDWESPRPTNAIFSRPNYEAPPSPYTAWSYIDLTGIVIQDNVIRAGYTGRSTAAIAVAQITAAGATGVSNITISGNKVVSPDNIAYNFHMFEETNNELSGLIITNNVFNSGNTEISANTVTTASTWNDKISFFDGNKELDDLLIAETISFADGDTTPSVITNTRMPSARFFTFTNTGATNVTDFDDEYEGQEIICRLNANTTIVYAAGIIRTKGSVNIAGTSTNQLVGFRKIGTVWIETWRNF